MEEFIYFKYLKELYAFIIACTIMYQMYYLV